MPKIIRAEFLSYYNSAIGSDKVFNVFLIEETDGSYSCVTEYGRRGNKLVQRILCVGKERSIAEGKLRQKLLAKRNHRSTPYSTDQFGFNYSNLAKEYEFFESDDNNSNTDSVDNSTLDESSSSESNVIKFPEGQRNVPRDKPPQTGIFNKGQFDSLEI